MNIVIFSHPEFLNSKSMPKFARMIEKGMREKGHNVIIWSPKPFFYKIPVGPKLRKWLGYADQYLLFPVWVRFNLIFTDRETIFVFSDQALGPWVPLVSKRPHVIHVHDLMALKSSLGEMPRNKTGWSGRVYQSYIRNGFSKGRRFISVSNKTASDLNNYIKSKNFESRVVFNGLNYPFSRLSHSVACGVISEKGLPIPIDGFLMHVGGNQWYKNRVGVLGIYGEYADSSDNPLPLLMIGEAPNTELLDLSKQIQRGKIIFLTGLDDAALCAAYSLASLLIFPSISEGFGWPIAEALATGCLVATTNAAPMCEVGGDAAIYLPPVPHNSDISSFHEWAKASASVVIGALSLSDHEINRRVVLGYKQAKLFDSDDVLAAYEEIYASSLVEGNV